MRALWICAGIAYYFWHWNRVWNIVTWVLVKLLRLVLSCSRYPGTISRTQRDLQRVGTFCFRDARIPNPVVVLLYCHWPSGRWFWNWFWMVLEGGPLFDDAHQCSLYIYILYRYMFSLSLILFFLFNIQYFTTFFYSTISNIYEYYILLYNCIIKMFNHEIIFHHNIFVYFVLHDTILRVYYTCYYILWHLKYTILILYYTKRIISCYIMVYLYDMFHVMHHVSFISYFSCPYYLICV